MHQQVTPQFSPLLTKLLPELLHHVISFLDPKSMFSLLSTNSFYYFNMMMNEYFKAYRFVVFMMDPVLAFPITKGKIYQIDDLPTMSGQLESELVFGQVIEYLGKRMKYLGGRDICFTTCKHMIELRGIEKNDQRLIGLYRSIAILMSQFRWFGDLSDECLANTTNSTFEFCKQEFLIWVEISKELSKENILQTLNVEKISNLMSKSLTYPHGVKEIEMVKKQYIFNTYEKLKKIFLVDRSESVELAQFIDKYNNQRNIFYLLVRIGLMHFNNLPSHLQEDCEFVSFCIRHCEKIDMRTRLRPQRPFVAHFGMNQQTSIRLSPKLACETSLVKQAFLTDNSPLYASVYLSSNLGQVDNKPFTRDDINVLTTIATHVPGSISFILRHNDKNQISKLEQTDLVQIIRKAPNVFESLDPKYAHYDQYTDLCNVAIKSRGENFSALIFPKSFSNMQIVQVFKVALENLENPHSYTLIFNKLPQEIQTNIPLLKDIIPHCPDITFLLERDLFDYDFCMFLSSHVPVNRVLRRVTYDSHFLFESELFNNLEFARRQLFHFPEEIEVFPNKILENDEIFDIVLRSGINLTMSSNFQKKLRSSPEWIKKALENGANIFSFDEQIYTNQEFFKIAMKINPQIMMVDDQYVNNKEMAMYLIQCCKQVSSDLSAISFSYFSNQLLNDSEFVEKAVLETGTFTDIQHLPEHLKNDLKIIKATLCKKSRSFLHLSEKLKNDRELAEFAIRCNPQNYNDMPSHLKDCREMFLLAISRGLNQVVSGNLMHEPNDQQDPFIWRAEPHTFNGVTFFNIKLQ